MRKSLLLSVMVMLCTMMSGVSAWAQSWTASAPAAGTFYIYNVGAEKFMTSGAWWGSHSIINPDGAAMSLTLVSSGNGYTISTNSIYENMYLGDNEYMDNGTSTVWVFEAVSGQTNTYKMKNGSNYLRWDSSNNACLLGADPGNNTGYWKLATRNNLISGLDNATLASPINATFLITNSWFAKGNGLKTDNSGIVPKGWSGDIVTDYWGINSGGLDCNFCIEQYHKTFDNYQSFTGVPNGIYTLSVQGFYRPDGTVNDPPVLYANSDTEPLKLLTSENPPTTPNGIGTAAEAFNGGYYKVDVTTKVTNNTLRVGVKSATSNICWVAFDNFSLVYKGPDVSPLSTEAIEFPGNGVTLTANTWYYYSPSVTGIHQFLASNLSTFAYTFNGDQNINGTVTSSALTSTLDVQERIYFKTTSATTLTINPPTNISEVAQAYPGSTTNLTANTWYYYDAPAEGDYTFTATLGSLSNFVYTENGAQNIYGTVSTTALPEHLTLTGNRIYFKATATSRLSIGVPAMAIVNGWTAGTGDYYIYNVGARRFMNQGTSWGTHAVVDGAGQVINITGSSNAYKLHFEKVTGNKYLDNGGWSDRTDGEDGTTTWTFESVSLGGYTNVYKLKANTGGNYLHWNGGSGTYGNEAVTGANGNDAGYYWLLIRKSDREDTSVATGQNPVDVTWKLTNPDMEGADPDGERNPDPTNNPGWTAGSGDNFARQSNGADGTVAMFLEKWVDAASPLSYCETRQNVVNLPGGHYRLSVTASALRQNDMGATIIGASFYAGDQSVTISGLAQTYNLDFVHDGGNVIIGYKVKDTNANWVYFDNVRLSYYGEVAQPLPNDLTTELIAGQWYYYDVSAMGPYTMEGNITNIVFTQNGNNLLDANPTTKTVQSKLILNQGRTYFKASGTGSTLKVTSVNEEGETATFTAATLNVDGLPAKILFVNINPDGRGANGATQISKYIMQKKYDLIGIEEDFNYHSNLISQFGNTYGIGAYRGSVTGLSNNTDGLEFFWNKDNGREAGSETITQYTSIASTDGNQYIKKGFRYYEVTIQDGMTIDVYVTHMDAGDTEGDNGSMASRGRQLTQLANAIMQNSFTNRPKLILGDTNCRYWRDAVTANLIDPINNQGKFVIKDAFIEQENGGNYPYVGSASISGEVVDKIFYLNPTATGSMQIIPELFWKETDYVENTVENNGVMDPLGDHPPVVVRFRLEKPALQLADIKDRWEWTGEPVQYGVADKWYLYNVNFGRWDSGRNGFLTTDATLVRDPNLSNVKRFALWGDGSGASISNDDVKLKVWYGAADYKAGLIPASESGATTFKVFDTNDSESSPEYAEGVNLAYHFKGTGTAANNHFFGANSPTELDAHTGTSKLNAWALISYQQLLVYNRYCKAWDKGNIYLTFLPLDDETRDDLTELLQRTGVRWTDTTTADLEALNAQIEEWFDDNQTTRIVNPSFELDENGNQLTTNAEYTNYLVPGWTVPNDVAEAFISNKDVSGEGWTRNFNDVDGNYLFNTYNNGNAAPNDFYVRQTITGLPEGFYKLTAVATTDTGNSITLELGSSTFTTPVDKSRPESIHLELPLYYHDGESSLTLGASSKTWFEIDDFKLYRYDYYYDETIGTSEYATTAIRYNTDIPAGVEVYYVTEINEKEETGGKIRNTIHMEKYEGNQLAAGEGVVLYKAGNNQARQFRFYRTNDDVSMISANKLLGAVNRIEVADKQAGCTYYVLAKKTITHDKLIETVDETTGEVTRSVVEATEPVVGFYKLKDTTAVPAHKAYLRVDANNAFAVKTGYLFDFGDEFEGDATGVTVVEAAPSEVIEGIYSLSGARIDNLQPGVNILRMSDGSVKKVLVK